MRSIAARSLELHVVIEDWRINYNINGRDRKTVLAYLAADREPGVRRPAGEVDPFDRFEPYVRQRLKEGPHVWATTLFDEVVALGFVRAIRRLPVSSIASRGVVEVGR